MGCVYRSPNCSEENNNQLFKLLKSDVIANYSKVCIVGDFNFPNVSWDGRWCGEKANAVLEHVQDSFLIQKVQNPTRRRIGQNPTLDDWVLVSQEDLVSEVIHQDPLGKK